MKPDYNELDNTIPVFCTARIPAELLNGFFTEAFEAKELKDQNCTHIAILVDTLEKSELIEPTRAPVKEGLQYPFLDWSLEDIVKFAWQFGSEQGICQAEFVILDERTLRDKTAVLVTPSEMSDDMENGPRLTARSDFRSSLIMLNVKSLGVGGDEPWEQVAEGSVIRIYGEEPGASG